MHPGVNQLARVHPCNFSATTALWCGVGGTDIFYVFTRRAYRLLHSRPLTVPLYTTNDRDRQGCARRPWKSLTCIWRSNYDPQRAGRMGGARLVSGGISGALRSVTMAARGPEVSPFLHTSPKSDARWNGDCDWPNLQRFPCVIPSDQLTQVNFTTGLHKLTKGDYHPIMRWTSKLQRLSFLKK